jgi:carbon-monoxide dehydrogenase large subunit
LLDYGLPRAGDLPSFEIATNAVPTASNPLGVKGAGECGTTPATAALVGAVADALGAHGVRHLEMPLTPERIWRALQRSQP